MTTRKIALFLYSEYLNIHMILCICFDDFHLQNLGIPHMETVCQDSLYCTTITMIWHIKMLLPTAQLPQIFIITPFQKMMNILPRNKTRQNKSQPYTV